MNSLKKQIQTILENAEFETYPNSAMYSTDFEQFQNDSVKLIEDISIRFADWIENDSMAWDRKHAKGFNNKQLFDLFKNNNEL